MTATLNAEVRLRLRDQTGIGTNSARRNITKVDGALTRLTRNAAGLVAGGLVLAKLTQAAGFAIRSFSNFEEGLIAIGKTANLSGSALTALGDDIEGIAARVPVARDELLGMATVAGQLGIKGASNISLFTEEVAKLTLATDLVGSEAALQLARMLNVTGEAINSVGVLGNVLVRLGNDSAASEREILNFASQIASGTAIFNTASTDAVAYGATLASLGQKVEAAGTVIQRTFQEISLALNEGGESAQTLAQLTGKSIDELRQQFGEDSVSVVNEFIVALGEVDEVSYEKVLDSLSLVDNRVRRVLGALAKNSDELLKSFALQRDELNKLTATDIEAAAAAEAFAKQMQFVKTDIEATAKSIGGELAPAILFISERWRVAGVAITTFSALLAGRYVAAQLASAAATRLHGQAIFENIRFDIASARSAQVAALAQLNKAKALLAAATTSKAATAATIQLAAAEATATAATTAHAAALSRTAIAATGMARAAGIARSAVLFLGGPIGIISGLLIGGATAWALWGDEAEDAAEKVRRALFDDVSSSLNDDSATPAAVAKANENLNDVILELIYHKDQLANVDAKIAAGLDQIAGGAYGGLAVGEFVKGLQSKRAAIEREILQAEQAVDGLTLKLNSSKDIIAQRNIDIAPGASGEISTELDAQLSYDESRLDRYFQAGRISNREYTDYLLAANNSRYNALKIANEAFLKTTAGQETDAAGERAALQIENTNRIEQINHDSNARSLAETERFIQTQTALASAAGAARDAQLRSDGLALERSLENNNITAEQYHARRRALVMEEYANRIDDLRAQGEREGAEQQAINDRVLALEIQRRDALLAIRAEEAESTQAIIANSLQEYADKAKQASDQIGPSIVNAFEEAENALVEFVRTGKISFASLADSIIDDLLRIAIQKNITGPLGDAFSGLFSGGATAGRTGQTGFGGAGPAGINHAGGFVGESVRMRNIPPGAFAGAPRFHGGGIIGHDERAIIGQVGEEVLARDDPRNSRNGGGGQNIRVQITNSGAAKSATASTQPDFDGKGFVISIVTDDLNRNGPIAQSISNNNGGARRVS